MATVYDNALTCTGWEHLDLLEQSHVSSAVAPGQLRGYSSRHYAMLNPECLLQSFLRVDGSSDEDWRKDAREALASIEGLNRTQQRAIARALSATFTLWQV